MENSKIIHIDEAISTLTTVDSNNANSGTLALDNSTVTDVMLNGTTFIPNYHYSTWVTNITSDDFSVRKVENGFILKNGNKDFVFNTLKDMLGFISEMYKVERKKK